MTQTMKNKSFISENKFKNIKIATSIELESFLQLIADLNEELDLFAMIIKHQKLDFLKLKERYYRCAETAIIADYDYKFKHLEKEYKK